MRRKVMVLTVLAALCPASARGERIKDIVEVGGVRSNPLTGIGLVVGLNGTGDDALVSRRAAVNVLRTQGIDIVLKPDDFTSKNIATVLVTAQLPPFARRDSSIDVTVSAMGSAASLQGGTLLRTNLLGADGQVYAVAQGPLIIGGFQAAGLAAKVQKNVVTVGRIPNGAHVEREERAVFVEDGEVLLQLRNPDFTTAKNVAEAVNKVYPKSSHAPDAGSVRVKVPKETPKTGHTALLHTILSLAVEVDNAASVVINERTGTIVIGKDVRVSTVAISHGNLHIITEEKDFASQPQPFSRGGTTTKLHRTEIQAIEERSGPKVLAKQTDVGQLARALRSLGLTPRDLISIFQALRAEGALQGELKVIR